MDFGAFGKVGFSTGVDYIAGAAVSQLVESFAPPIEHQTPGQLFLEGLLQLIIVMEITVPVAKLLSEQEGEDLTGGLPYTYGLFQNMPNTRQKLRGGIEYLKMWLMSFVNSDVQASEQ
jgi:hypothetical protein